MEKEGREFYLLNPEQWERKLPSLSDEELRQARHEIPDEISFLRGETNFKETPEGFPCAEMNKSFLENSETLERLENQLQALLKEMRRRGII